MDIRPFQKTPVGARYIVPLLFWGNAHTCYHGLIKWSKCSTRSESPNVLVIASQAHFAWRGNPPSPSLRQKPGGFNPPRRPRTLPHVNVGAQRRCAHAQVIHWRIEPTKPSVIIGIIILSGFNLEIPSNTSINQRYNH